MQTPSRPSAAPLLPGRRLALSRLGTLGLGALCAACGDAPLNTETGRVVARARIETDVFTALGRCRAALPGSRALLDEAAAWMAFPAVTDTGPAGSDQAGAGALRIGNAFFGYYQLTAHWRDRPYNHATHAFLFLFSTLESLAPFQVAKPPEVIEAHIALPRVLPHGRLATPSPRPPLLLLALEEGRAVAGALPAAYTLEPLDL